MRYTELLKRQKLLKQEAQNKCGILSLMYADFEYINRGHALLLSEIESKLDELKLLKNELELLIDKAELDFSSKGKIKKLAQKRVQKIIGR